MESQSRIRKGKLKFVEEYPDYEYIAGYYAWDGEIYKKDETDR
ncbi:hypothetical protein [[Eubacterium] hominis]